MNMQDIVVPRVGFFALRRIRKDRREHNRGFEYASGRLLAGATVPQLEAEIMGDDGFIRGMRDAFAAWEKLEGSRM